MKEFIRNHFEEFVNRNNQRVGEVNIAAGFVDHGADVPPDLADRRPADRGALGLSGESSLRAQLGSGVQGHACGTSSSVQRN